MRAEPRRKERSTTREEMVLLLERMDIGHLAMMAEDGPYVVPVNYLFAEGCIYLHSGAKGKKMEALRADPRVCFLVDETGPQVTWDRGCGISQIYESVMCFGRAEFIEEREERKRILILMIRKFMRGEDALPLVDRNVDNTAVLRIRVEEMTGKANRLGPIHRIVPK